MKSPITAFFTLSALAGMALAQAVGDYRSAATGNWNVLATWERYNGTAWVTPTSGQGAPNSGDGAITIRNGHTVTVTANVTVDQTVIEAGGQVAVNSSRTLTIANGAGTDCTVGGILSNSGTVTTTGTLSIGAGGTYRHARNGGTVPTASWDAGSTCLVTGINGTAPSGLGQSFHHFAWNCPGQTSHIDANALASIAGDLTVAGTGSYRLNNSGGDITVAGDFIQTGGTFNPGSGSGGAQRFLLGGDFSQSGGTFRNNTGGGQVIVVFNGSSQSFMASGTMQNVIDFVVRPGTDVTLASDLPVNASAVLVDSGTLRTAGFSVAGAGSFTLPDGGTLGIGSADGITVLGTAAGSVQTTTARDYSTGAGYIYNGAAAQATGSGLPAAVNGLVIDNAAGVTLTNGCTVNGALDLANGILATGANTVTVSGTGSTSRTNGWVNGSLAKVIPTGPQAKTFEVGTANGYSPAAVAFANVSTQGTLTAKAFQAVHPNVALPLNCLQRYWRLTNTGISFSNYSTTFFYLPTDFNLNFPEATDEAAMVVGKYGAWSLPTIGARNPGGAADGGSIQVTGLTGFSDFTLAKNGGSLDGALAVALSQLSAADAGGYVALEWATESEHDNLEWLIERSDDAAGPYRAQTRVPGAGSSPTPRQYRWEDRQVEAGRAYCYRLGSVDLEGRVEYFGPVTVLVGSRAINEGTPLQAGPNPFVRLTTINYQITKQGLARLEVYNLQGQRVRTLVSEVKAPGRYETAWDGRGDSGHRAGAGVYFCRMETEEGSSTIRMTVLR